MSLNTQYNNFYDMWNSQSLFYSATTQQTVNENSVNVYQGAQLRVQNQLYPHPNSRTTSYSHIRWIETAQSLLTTAEAWAKNEDKERAIEYLQSLHFFVLNPEMQLKALSICQWIGRLDLWFSLIQKAPIGAPSLTEKVLSCYYAELNTMHKSVPDTENSLNKVAVQYKGAKHQWTWWYQFGRFYEKYSANIALNCYSRSLELAPEKTHAKIYFARAYLYYSNSYHEQGYKTLQQVFCTLRTTQAHFFIYPYLLKFSFLFGLIEKTQDAIAKVLNMPSKPWLSHAMLIQFQILKGNQKEAESLLDHAMNAFPDKARFYLIKAEINYGKKPENEIMAIINTGIELIPKSGELYCELARFHLNPLSSYFNLNTALQLLQTALTLTPQYGDIYLELIRYTLIKNGLAADTTAIEEQCHFTQKTTYGALWEEPILSSYSSIKEKLAYAKEKIIAHLLYTSSLYSQHSGHNLHNTENGKKEWCFQELMYAFVPTASYVFGNVELYRQKTKLQLEHFLNCPKKRVCS